MRISDWSSDVCSSDLLWTGSVAVMSDAFHTFSAVGGILIALAAQRLGERGASPAQTFGWIRAEILGALFNGLFLVGMAIYVLWMGAMRLMEPIDLAKTPMLLAAAGGNATELVALWLLFNQIGRASSRDRVGQYV